MSTARRMGGFAALGLLVFSGACAQVLDIEEAHVDPTLSAGARGATAGASGLAESGASNGGALELAGSGSSGAGSRAGAPISEGEAGKSETPSAGAGNSMAGATAEEPDECESYCDAVVNNCKGKYQQYRTFDQCIQVCKRLPHGKVGDDNTNSVQCRIGQARFAETEPFLYCKSAGPLGAGRCGSNCVSYCSLMENTCTPKSTNGNLEASFYKDTQECLSACSALPVDDKGPVQYSTSAMSEPTSFIGNNVYCRTFHVTAALEQDAPTEHCPHAMGAYPCDAP